jgi:para-aminobenzoate synthetase component 1
MLSVSEKTNLIYLAGEREKYFIYLDSNGYPDHLGTFNWIIAGGNQASFIPIDVDDTCWDKLSDFVSHQKAPFIPAFLGYDLKNTVEKLVSENTDNTGFPLMAAWLPDWIIGEDRNGNPIIWGNVDTVLHELSKYVQKQRVKNNQIHITSDTNRESYYKNFEKLQKHLARGDIYEINYCLHYSAIVPELDPIDLFLKMNKRSPAPFSCLMKISGQWLCCASPERFLVKHGNTVTAQPIKGTTRRTGDAPTDELLAESLKSNPKERAENIMIVDLLRNDLSKLAVTGRVYVRELCEVYPFATVQQLISTIEAEMPSTVEAVNILKNAFPMGSMTGAPKIRAMELAEEVETFQRGLYSGAVGYFTNDGNFDFNVVIRSITWNKQNAYLSFSTGSAVTIQSTADQEFDECQLKAEALIQSLTS